MARTRKDAPESVLNAPPVNLAILAETVREEKVSAGGTRWINNPFVALLRESYLLDDGGENGWKGFDVQGAQVRQVVAALRNAANQLANDEIGIRLRYSFVNDEGVQTEQGNLHADEKNARPAVPEDDRKVTVKFLGRPRKIYLSDEQKAEAREHGFIIGEPGDESKIDTARYLQWVQEAEAGDEEADDGTE